MLTVLFPMSKEECINESCQFPKSLIEINNLTMIERVIKKFESIYVDKYIFILNENDCNKYYLDNTIKLLLDKNVVILTVNKPTKGAACSALLAIEHMNADSELIISNADQIIEGNLSEIIDPLRSNHNIDAGVVTFNSVHPKWSFVKVEGDRVIESAEKRPISHHAIAGIYYYRKTSFFIDAAMDMMRKQLDVDGIYYISPTLNELILKGKYLSFVSIPKSLYFNFYEHEKLKKYELFLDEKDKCITVDDNLDKLTYKYILSFNSKNISEIDNMLLNSFSLEGQIVKKIRGKQKCIDVINGIFSTSEVLNISVNNIFTLENTSIVEFNLNMDNTTIAGVYIIDWQNSKMAKLKAYFHTPKRLLL